MNDDLVKRLAFPYPKDEDVEEVSLPVWVILLTTEAADRIEELEGQLKTVLDRETSILRYYDAKLDAAEAKLLGQAFAAPEIKALVDALKAFSAYDRSAFFGPDAEKNKRAVYRGVKRKITKALIAVGVKP